MGVNSIYYCDLRNTRGRRYRVTILPPASTTLTPANVPAWGADPGVGSNYLRIPTGAITLGPAQPTGSGQLPTATDARFTNDLPWGLAETTTYSLTVDFRLLQSTADLQYIAARLINYRATVANAINQTVAADAYSDGPRTITTTPLFTITHDADDPDTLVGDFAVRFQGVIRTTPGRKGTIIPGSGVTVSFELYHIARAVLDVVTMGDVAIRTFHTSYGSGATQSPQSGSGAGFERVYDLLWRTSGNVHGWLHEPKDQRVRLYHRAHLMLSAQTCAEEAYAAFARRAVDTTGWHFRFRGYREDATDYHATPWDHWTYYKHDHTSDAATVTNERGAVLDARDETFFLGTIALASSPTVYYGGLLHRFESGSSLHDFGTLWEFLAEATNEAAIKAVVRQPSATGCEVWFVRLDDSSTGSTTSASLADVRGAAEATGTPETIGFDAGGVAVSGAQIAPRRVYEAEVPDAIFGNTSENRPMTTQTVFDTRSSLGEGVHWPYAGAHGEFTFATFERRIGAWPIWKLCYVDTPLGASGACALIVHDSVRVDDGTTDNDFGLGATVALPTTSGALMYDSPWTREVKEAISARQRAGTNINAIAQLAVERFGPDRDPVTYTMTVTDDIAEPGRLGDAYSFGTNAGDLVDTGEATLDSLSVDCVLVAVKIDDTANLAECTFLATS